MPSLSKPWFLALLIVVAAVLVALAASPAIGLAAGIAIGLTLGNPAAGQLRKFAKHALTVAVCGLGGDVPLKLVLDAGKSGIVYTAIAGGAGIWFIYESHVLYREAQGDHKPAVVNRKAMKVFHISITYLSIVFLALAIDPFVGNPLFG